MIRRPGLRNQLAFACALWVAFVLPACSDDDNGVDPDDRLCGGETGIGLLIEGASSPVEFCVDDDRVSAVLTSQDRYDVGAQFSTSEGDFIVHMVFAVQPFPATLHVTEFPSEAEADPSAVWIYYQEVSAGAGTIESYEIDGGSFTLSFVDEDVAAGTLHNVVFRMRDFSSQDPAGTRIFADGTFSISIKDPAAVQPIAVRAR